MLYGIYLLKVSFCLLTFYVLYATMLRHTTFFHLNRYYLSLSIVISFVIPTVTLSGLTQAYHFSFADTFENELYEPYGIAPSKPVHAISDKSVNYAFLLSATYSIGVSFLLIRLVILVIRMMQTIKNSKSIILNNIKVVRTKQPGAFTFFNTIFIPEYEISPVILAHEEVHVKQLHWIDLLLIEITCILLWFNPLVFLYRRAIQLQHEYLADSHTIEKGVSIEQYLNCLLNQLQTENAFVLINKFYSRSIKNRIMMMTKNKTPMKLKSIYLLLIPVLFLLLAAFSSKPLGFKGDAMIESAAMTVDDNIPSIAPIEMANAKISSGFGKRVHPETGKDQFHTGIDLLLPAGEPVMATANGTVAESFNDKLRGNYIVIKHDDKYTTSYSHLQSSEVKVGDKVARGQKIGYVGSTGQLSSGPHLHYEVIKNGKPVDPKDYFPGK